jgi:hypothetical protein
LVDVVNFDREITVVHQEYDSVCRVHLAVNLNIDVPPRVHGTSDFSGSLIRHGATANQVPVIRVIEKQFLYSFLS